MKKVESYVVVITESKGIMEVSCRESSFTDLRSARSFYRTCLDFYAGFHQLSGVSHVADIELFKEYNNNETVLIDCDSFKF